MSGPGSNGELVVPLAEEPIAVSVVTLWVEHFSEGRVGVRFHVSPPLGLEPRNVAQLLRQQADQLDRPAILRAPRI